MNIKRVVDRPGSAYRSAEGSAEESRHLVWSLDQECGVALVPTDGKDIATSYTFRMPFRMRGQPGADPRVP